MASNFFKLLLIEVLFHKVMTSYLQQAQQYLQVPGQACYQISGMPPAQAMSHSYEPAVPTSYQPVISSTYMDHYSYPTLTSPYSEKIQSYKIPVPNSALPPKLPYSSPLASKSTKSPKITQSCFDSNVLNNLAIALQLLIVNNLLNMRISEHAPIPNTFSTQQKTLNEYESVQTVNPFEAYYATSSSYSNSYPNSPVSQSYFTNVQPPEYGAYFESNPYEQISPSQFSLPNANYLGSHNLGGLLSSFGVPPATARPGLNLQSPYDVIASTPISEKTSSSPFEYTKYDFQSPYSAILAADYNKDLFSMDF